MHAAPCVHFLIVFNFDLEKIDILVALVNTVRNAEISFFTHSRSIGTGQKVSGFGDWFAVLSSGI